MTTTTVPRPGKPARGMRIKYIQSAVHEWLEETQGNLDKANSLDDSFYYNGMTDAYSDVLWFIENNTANALHARVSAKLLALVPVAILVHHFINEHRKAQDA
jgi:hypothetical protein